MSFEKKPGGIPNEKDDSAMMSRRDFLKKATMAAGAVGIGVASLGASQEAEAKGHGSRGEMSPLEETLAPYESENIELIHKIDFLGTLSEQEINVLNAYKESAGSPGGDWGVNGAITGAVVGGALGSTEGKLDRYDENTTEARLKNASAGAALSAVVGGVAGSFAGFIRKSFSKDVANWDRLERAHDYLEDDLPITMSRLGNIITDSKDRVQVNIDRIQKIKKGVTGE